jgi:hypothetical protein
MPLYLRRFIFNEIKEFYDEESKASKKGPKNPNQNIIHPGSTSNTPKSTPKKPSPQPSKSVKYK